jgi:hypothetical protein
MDKKRTGFILVIFAAMVLVHLLLAREYFFLTDDAFISFRYLANWLSGDGLVFNPGERVEGYTNFLWIVILALPSMIGIELETAAPGLGIISSVVLVVAVFLCGRISREEKQISWSWLIAPLFLVLMRTFNIWATGGLETRFFSMLVFVGALFAFKAIERPHGFYWVVAGAVFAVAELTRPEGLLFFAVAAALVSLGRIAVKKPFITKNDLLGLGVFFLIVGSHYSGRYLYYSLWFPNTFYAKVGGSRFDLGFLYLGIFGLEYAFYFWLVPLAFFIYRSFRSRDIFSVYWFLFCGPYLLYIAYIGGDHFEYRFLDPVLPFIAVVLSQVVLKWARPAQVFNQKRFIAASVFVFVFFVYQQSLHLSSTMFFDKQYRTSTIPEIKLSKTPFRHLPGFSSLAWYFTEGYRLLLDEFAAVRWEEHKAFWLQQVDRGMLFRKLVNEGLFKTDDVFCMPFIGALPYYSKITVLDFHGLTDPVIARSETGLYGGLFHMHYPSAEYMEKRKVDFLVKGEAFFSVKIYQRPPWIYSGPREVDLDNWRSRRYMARLGDIYMFFYSTRSPGELSRRFTGYEEYPLYIYVPDSYDPVNGLLSKPVRLQEWLDKENDKTYGGKE